MPFKWISHHVYIHINAKQSLPKTFGEQERQMTLDEWFRVSFPKSIEQEQMNAATEESWQHVVTKISFVAKQQNLQRKSRTESSRAWKPGSVEIVLIAVTNKIRKRSEGVHCCPDIAQRKANTQQFCQHKSAHKLQTTVFLTQVLN